MPMTTPHLIPLPRHAGPALPPGAPCAAWSVHAAELAADVADLVLEWGQTPTVQVLEAEGQLVQLLPGIFAPPDLLDSPIDRVISLGCAIGSRLRAHHVVAGVSAAWVCLGGPPPSPAELLSMSHRSTVAGAVIRHAQLRAGDVETVGGAPVTVPARTAADLLRFERPPGVLELVGRLLDEGHVTVEGVSERLAAMHRHPGSRAAGARLLQVIAARSNRAA